MEAKLYLCDNSNLKISCLNILSMVSHFFFNTEQFICNNLLSLNMLASSNLLVVLLDMNDI